MAVNFGVNYLAVVVAAVVALVIGFIWYSPPVFGNRWMAYLGTTRPSSAILAPLVWRSGSSPRSSTRGCSRCCH